MSLSKIQCLSISQKGPYQIFQFLSFSNKGVKWPIFLLTDHLDSKFSPEDPNASPCTRYNKYVNAFAQLITQNYSDSQGWKENRIKCKQGWTFFKVKIDTQTENSNIQTDKQTVDRDVEVRISSHIQCQCKMLIWSWKVDT